MAIPTFVAAGTVAERSGSGNFTPGLPAGIQTNDILIIGLEIANDGDNVDPPTGYTFLTGGAINTGSTGTRCAVFWKRATASESAPLMTLDSGGDHAIARIIAIRGCVESGSPFNVSQNGNKGTASTSVSLNALITTVTDCLIVGCVSNSADIATGTAEFSGWANSNLANVTERTDDSYSGGNGGALAFYTGEWASTGNTGATTATTATSGANGYVHMALKPRTSGTISATLQPVTATGAGNVHDDATMSLTLPKATMALAGIATPPSGSVSMTLSPVTETFAGVSAASGGFAMTLQPVTESFAGQIIHGSFSMTLPPVSGVAFTGSVNPIGSFSLSLPSVSMAFVSETIPFGAQVIKVEPDHRAFRVTDDGDGLIPIKRSQVTDA